MRNEILTIEDSLGLTLREKILEEAMPLQSLQGDHEAEYNDHYKIKGYKVDSVTNHSSLLIEDPGTAGRSNALDCPLNIKPLEIEML